MNPVAFKYSVVKIRLLQLLFAFMHIWFPLVFVTIFPLCFIC